MKEKIAAFLKTKLTGVQDAFINGAAEVYSRTIQQESDIETTLTEGIIETLRFSAAHVQAEGDRRATSAATTAVKTFRDKHGLDENGKPVNPKQGDPNPGDPNPGDPTMPEWFKAYKKENDATIAKLNDTIARQESEKKNASLSTSVTNKLKEKGIPAEYLKGRNLTPESEDKIDAMVEAIEADYKGFTQWQTEQGVVISPPPGASGTIKEGEKIGKDLAEKRNATTSEKPAATGTPAKQI